MFGAVVFGEKEVLAAMAKVVAGTEVGAHGFLTAASALVEQRAKANFQGAHALGQPHTGGDRPNVVTGQLRASISPDPIESVAGGLRIRMGPRMIYSRSVEFGNPRNRSRGFPYFTPAVDESRAEIAALAYATFTVSTRTF